MLQEEKPFTCPYCWERQTVLLDLSVDNAQFIQDCEVCCRPINFTAHVDESGEATVIAEHEDEC